MKGYSMVCTQCLIAFEQAVEGEDCPYCKRLLVKAKKVSKNMLSFKEASKSSEEPSPAHRLLRTCCGKQYDKNEPSGETEK